MKKTVSIILSVLICFLLAGCSPLEEVVNILYGNNAVQKAESLPHIGFSNGVLFEDDEEIILPASDFSEVNSQYEKYRSDIYYNALSPEEQTIYTAFEYALENNYSNILIDSLLADSADTLIMVLEYLALDSPLLEQNLRYEVGDFTTSMPVEILGLYSASAEFDGYYISVNNFTKEMWDKKLEAVHKAKEIVESLPAGLSDFERAEELYLHLAENIEYYSYEEGEASMEVYPYLYDALITGKTQCDGHANALSLLLRLASIPSVEKMYTADSKKDDEVGHTWVAFEIDGYWYNADSTSADLIPKKESSMKSGFYFAFSDELRLYSEDYDEVTPVCEQSKYMKPDAVVSDLSTDAFSNEVEYAYLQKNPDWALIIVTRNNPDLLDKQIQESANKTLSTVYWSTIDLANGNIAVLVYEKGLF